MIRATTSVFVALVLVFVLFGGSCLACATVIGGVNHSCCDPKKGCQERPFGSPADCISPAVDLAKIDQASALVVVSFPAFNAVWDVDVRPPYTRAECIPPDPVLHRPPDLYLLNSILTI